MLLRVFNFLYLKIFCLILESQKKRAVFFKTALLKLYLWLCTKPYQQIKLLLIPYHH
jgi:hypothetical protein